MRALVYTGPGKVEIQDWPHRRRAGAGEVEVSVELAGLCGADITAFQGRCRSRTPPMILGHELVGHTSNRARVVVDPLIPCGRCIECASGATNLCRDLRLLGMGNTAGCFAELVVVPESQIHPIDESLENKLAVFVEPLANVVHLFRSVSLLAQRRIGILGAGTMGTMILQRALQLGCKQVLVEEIVEERRLASEQIGATMALTPLRQHEAAREFVGRGLDVVVDACGTSAARQRAFELCRPGGTVVLFGLADPLSEIHFATSIRNEHRVLMSFGYTKQDFAQSLELLTAGAVNLSQWTAEMPLEQGQQAFERMVHSRGGTLKMLLRI